MQFTCRLLFDVCLVVAAVIALRRGTLHESLLVGYIWHQNAMAADSAHTDA